MVKIEFTPLSLDRKIFPFKKGFKKSSPESRRKKRHFSLLQWIDFFKKIEKGFPLSFKKKFLTGISREFTGFSRKFTPSIWEIIRIHADSRGLASAEYHRENTRPWNWGLRQRIILKIFLKMRYIYRAIQLTNSLIVNCTVLIYCRSASQVNEGIVCQCINIAKV